MSPDVEDVSSPEPGAELDDAGTMGEDDRTAADEKSPSQQTNASSQPPSSKSNAKDPSRPRRKKARRACFACQRAHLTCGDERPCLRCIKRGLQDQCHDGVRKKAKYLHDAPPEALVPGYAGKNYAPHGSGSLTAISNSTTVMPSANYFTPASAGGFPQQYPHASGQGAMGPPSMDNGNIGAEFASAQNVETPTQYNNTSSSQQVSPQQEFVTTLDQTPSIGTTGTMDTTYFDANDPLMFNFNISDMNFGNHYGALEFGMLGHLSSGAINSPDVDSMNTISHSHQGSVSYDGNSSYQPGYNYNQGFPSWQTPGTSASRQSSATNVWAGQSHGLEAYAIGEQASSLTGASPHSQNQDFTGYQSATTSPEAQFVQPEQSAQPDLLRQRFSQAQRKQAPFPGDSHTESDRKRRRNTSEVYSSVQAPYPYTQGFHALTALLKKRFTPKRVLHIAKALATIRPSFISCNQHLDDDDLIFMEKCFQRTLLEYESFLNSYGTPTVICRRTGEIAAVSKEFCLVTGWRKDVLLGKEPNLNVNTGMSPTPGTQTGTSSRGAATPRISSLEVDSGRPQPVFLAELMDEDSVVQFYEDFAELAFGASKTSIISAPCSLLKYRTKEDPGWGPNDHLADDGKRMKASDEVKTENVIRGEAGMNALGERDGRVSCQMCWTVKRDVFDIPMLIVMNFLPII